MITQIHDPSPWLKPPIDLDLECSALLPGEWAATVAAHLLPELSELSQREVFTVLTCHPVLCAVIYYATLTSISIEAIHKTEGSQVRDSTSQEAHPLAPQRPAKIEPSGFAPLEVEALQSPVRQPPVSQSVSFINAPHQTLDKRERLQVGTLEGNLGQESGMKLNRTAVGGEEG